MMNKADLVQKTQIHRLFRPFYGGIGHALTFHRVVNNNNWDITSGLQVTQTQLERVIKYFLSQKIDIVSLDEFYERIKSPNNKNRFVTFTFDDGYVDNLTHALPIFEKYNVPFSVFVTTGYCDKTEILWWYILEDYLSKKSKIEYVYNNKEYSFKTISSKDKRIAFARIKTFLCKSFSLKDYRDRIEALFADSGYDLYQLNQEVIMSWDQIKTLHNHPLVTIGAHGIHHLALSQLDSDEIRAEISGSINRLESVLGSKIDFFAYPYGTLNEVNDKVFEVASQCGVKMAFTTERSNVFRRHSEALFALPRIGINSVMKVSHIDIFVNGMAPFVNKLFKLYSISLFLENIAIQSELLLFV